MITLESKIPVAYIQHDFHTKKKTQNDKFQTIKDKLLIMVLLCRRKED